MRHVGTFLLFGLVVGMVLATVGCGAKDKASDVAASIAGGKGEEDPGHAITSPSASQPADGKGKSAQPYHPVVEVETTMGNFSIELYPDKAPITVDNFLKYVKEGFYDSTVVHYVDRASVIIAGGYSQDLREKKTQTPINNEAKRSGMVGGLSNTPLTVAMVRLPDSKDSATSQFFVNVADNSSCFDYKDMADRDYGYCVFGRVLPQGQQTIAAIANVEAKDVKQNDMVFDKFPVEKIVIRSIKKIH